MNPKGLQVSTPTDTTIVLTRTFNAPRRLVWEAMTDPVKMRCWMLAPPGWTLAVCVCEARVGGALRLAWRSEDADPVMTLQGVFTEVVPHERMVHTETMVLGSGETLGSLLETHEFSERNGVTTMRITQAYDSKEARDGAVASGMEHGMEAGYKQLDSLLVHVGGTPMSKLLLLVLLPFLAASASAQTRTQDVVYMKTGGMAFTMDVLAPAKPNKAAVVFVVSGGWFSDYPMLQRYDPDIEKVFANAGFTVFEVVHGAQPRFKVAEIVEQVQTAVRFVHAHASDYGVDTNRVGVTGISTGGHLSLMIAGSPDSPVNAVAAIAPPTDLANWGKPSFMLIDDPQMAMFIPVLGIDPKAPKNDIEALIHKLSPISFVNPKYPPTLIVHGDSDKIVPLQQSQAMDAALAKAGVEHKLEVIPGCGHDDKTFGPGLEKALQWFKDKLLK